MAPDFLPAAAARELTTVVYDTLSAAQSVADANLADHFRRWNGVWLDPLPQFLASANPELGARLQGALAAVSGRAGRLLGRKWLLLERCSFFRRPNSPTSLLRWHIDADGGQIGKAMCVNVWLPLDVVGTDLPSLDLIPGSHRKMRKLPHLTDGDYDRDDAFAAALGTAVTPRLDPGDALIFDQYTLHRSQPTARKEFSRTSCELRFTRD